MIKVGIYGATGYTGLELVSILESHPQTTIQFATSNTYAGRSLSEIVPAAPDLPLIQPNEAPLDTTDVIFLCLPHAAAANTAVTALQAHNRVIDLSADFRIADATVYEKWYGVAHPAPHLLATAVYGLTEFARNDLCQTQLVANPGCYSTTSLLALEPIIASSIELTGDIIIDAKSGVSGAGRSPQLHTHFVEVADNFSPYKIGRSHRHLPEMEQVLTWWCEQPPRLIFSPHLLPVPRGILANIYVSLRSGWQETEIRERYNKTYEDEPFVQVLPPGQLATLAHVVHSNRCTISLTFAANTMIITSATDNLIKGAAGQAVQNMNVMFNLNEETGLN